MKEFTRKELLDFMDFWTGKGGNISKKRFMRDEEDAYFTIRGLIHLAYANIECMQKKQKLNENKSNIKI